MSVRNVGAIRSWRPPRQRGGREVNREQRRQMKRAMRARGLSFVTLRGGPMNGWTAKPNAPCLEPDWRDKYLEGEAEKLYRSQPRGFWKPKWDSLPADERQVWLDKAAVAHGRGHYQVDQTGVVATWQAE